MRILGLDYGAKTVGVAVTDALGLTVQPLTTLSRKRENILRQTYVKLEELCREYEVTQLVVGLPLNMNDSEGDRARLARAFGETLARRTGLPLAYQDERLTTVTASEMLDETGFSQDRVKRKTVIDQLAACLILEDYLQSQEKSNG